MKVFADVRSGLFRTPPHRLVLVVLSALAAVVFAMALGGLARDPFTVPAMAASLVVLVGSSYGSNRLLARLWRVHPRRESALITGLILWFLFWPTTVLVDLGWLAAAAVLANASKYLLAWRGRHLLNPAAAGAFAVTLAQWAVGREFGIHATWWVAGGRLLPFVAAGALLVLWRMRRFAVAAVFAAVATALDTFGVDSAPTVNTVATVLASFPIVFFAAFMVSEPLTLPPKRWQQIVVAVVAALCFGYPLAVYRVIEAPPAMGVLTLTPELSLLVANAVAFALAFRQRSRRRPKRVTATS